MRGLVIAGRAVRLERSRESKHGRHIEAFVVSLLPNSLGGGLLHALPSPPAAGRPGLWPEISQAR